jgi:hypothetical protein
LSYDSAARDRLHKDAVNRFGSSVEPKGEPLSEFQRAPEESDKHHWLNGKGNCVRQTIRQVSSDFTSASTSLPVSS